MGVYYDKSFEIYLNNYYVICVDMTDFRRVEE